MEVVEIYSTEYLSIVEELKRMVMEAQQAEEEGGREGMREGEEKEGRQEVGSLAQVKEEGGREGEREGESMESVVEGQEEGGREGGKEGEGQKVRSV